MRNVVTGAALAASLLGLAIVGAPPATYAATQDGNWSVLIITEKGPCDRGYRYDVNVANGRVRYRGNAAVDLTGTVAPDGLVQVKIMMGDQGASGAGRLTASNGAGTWRGVGGSDSCAGRWEAERH